MNEKQQFNERFNSDDKLQIILLDRKDKDRFYIDRIVEKVLNLQKNIDLKNITKSNCLEQYNYLKSYIEDYSDRLKDKYFEYIDSFELDVIVPLQNIKFDNYKLSQNISHFDLKDYADFVKQGGNVVKDNLYNLNTMSKRQIELALYLQFVNMAIYDVRLNYLNEEKFDLFIALNDDENGIKLLATTNWYLQFYDADLFYEKWNYFKKMRFSDYLSASCLVIKNKKDSYE